MSCINRILVLLTASAAVTGAFVFAPAQAQTGLTYLQVAPCRIVDTREPTATSAFGGAGRLVPGTVYQYRVTGTTNFAQQGGSANGCGIPAGAKAVFFNLLSVEPTGLGNLRAWPTGTSVPLASVLNYALPNLNIANGIAVPICDSLAASCPGELNILAEGGSTKLVIDVVGYFR